MLTHLYSVSFVPSTLKYVWCGILVSLLFIPGKLTRAVYVNILEDAIDAFITQIIKVDKNDNIDRFYF